MLFFFNKRKILEPSLDVSEDMESSRRLFSIGLTHTGPTKYFTCSLKTHMTGLILQLDCTQLFFNVSIPTPITTKSLQNWRLFLCFITSKWSDSFQSQFSNFPPSLYSSFKGPYYREEKQTRTKLQFNAHCKAFSYNGAPGHDYYILASLENCFSFDVYHFFI